MIGTFHDVTSQTFRRLAQRNHDGHRRRWRPRAWSLARVERRAAGALDVAIVFSEKDQLSVDPRGVVETTVLHPAQQIAGPVSRQATPTPTVVSWLASDGRKTSTRPSGW